MAATAVSPVASGLSGGVVPENETDVDGEDDSEAQYRATTANEDMLAHARQHVEQERVSMLEQNKVIRQQLEV